MSGEIIVPGGAVVCDENQMAQLNKPITKLELATLLGELRREFLVSNLVQSYVNGVTTLLPDILSWIQKVISCSHGLCDYGNTSLWRLGISLWLRLKLSKHNNDDSEQIGLCATVFLRHPMFGLQNVYMSQPVDVLIDWDVLLKRDVAIRLLLNALLDVRLVDQFNICEHLDEVPNEVKNAFAVHQLQPQTFEPENNVRDGNDGNE
ncbi:MAG: hypothetical protein QXW98_04045 [Candidatus Caldarchaeum sp.]